MKKCIASFLICFVFAFGVITAFGCRDEVYAGEPWKIDASVPSDALFRAYMNDICELDGFENAYSTFWDFISSYDGSSFLSLYRFSYSCVLPAESSLAGQIYKEVWYSAIISSSSDFDTVCNSNTYCVLKSVSYYDGSILSQSSCSTATMYSSLNTIYNSYLDYSSRDGYTSTFGELWNSVDFNTSADFVFGSNYEFSEDLGSLTDISYKQLWEKTALGHDVYYKFDWNTKTSSGVNLTQDGYDVLYYWECSADVVSLFGKKSKIDPLYSDKFLCKSKQDGKVYSIVEKSSEGDFSSIFNEILDQQPLVTRSFDVKSTLHVAPVYNDGSNYKIGYWSHITFDNLANSEPIQDVVTDEFDGNGLEADYNTTSDDPTISSSSGSSTIGVGSTIDEAEHNSNSGTSSSINLDETSTNVSDAIGMFIGAIKSFVSLVSVTFSFLPDWVLAFVSLSVVIFCIMIVKRAIF